MPLTVASVLSIARSRGMKVTDLDKGRHIRVHLIGKDFVDVWPSTGRWLRKGHMGTSLSLNDLHKELFGFRPDAPTVEVKIRGKDAKQKERAKDLNVLSRALEWEAKRLNDIAMRIERGLPVPGPINVSDHALVRFLERVVGIDTDAIRLKIAQLLPPLADKDRGKHRLVKLPDGSTLLTRDSTVITALGPGMVAGMKQGDRDQQTGAAIDLIEVTSHIKRTHLDD